MRLDAILLAVFSVWGVSAHTEPSFCVCFRVGMKTTNLLIHSSAMLSPKMGYLKDCLSRGMIFSTNKSTVTIRIRRV